MATESDPEMKVQLKTEKETVTPNWEELVYAPERIQKFVQGKITLHDLNAVSGPEMLEMAVIGFSLYEQGRYRDAKAIFEGLNAMDPKEAYYVTALGAVHLAEENLPDAMKCFNEAIKLDGSDIAAHVNRGEVFLRQGNVMEAAQDFAKAVKLDPENKDPLTQRARILAAAALEAMGGDDAPSGQAKKTAPAKTAAAPAKGSAGKAGVPAGKAAPAKAAPKKK